MVPTCGKTIYHYEDYYVKYSNRYDNKDTCTYPRLAIDRQTWHFLSLIIKFNRERQCVLALEKKRPTRNCWTRCITFIAIQYGVNLVR